MLSTPSPGNPRQGGNKNLPCPERVMPIAFAPATYSSRAATGHNTTSDFRSHSKKDMFRAFSQGLTPHIIEQKAPTVRERRRRKLPCPYGRVV
eukprot:3092950-Pyramimonas_sp.AAC.1